MKSIIFKHTVCLSYQSSRWLVHRWRISASHLFATPSLTFYQSLLLTFLLQTLVQDLPAPPDGPDPSNDVQGCHHLESRDEKLSLAPACRVASARCDQCTASWKHDAEHHDNIGPGSIQTWHIGNDLPEFFVLRSVGSGGTPSILNRIRGNLGSVARSIFWLLLGSLLATQDYTVRALGLATHLIMLVFVHL